MLSNLMTENFLLDDSIIVVSNSGGSYWAWPNFLVDRYCTMARICYLTVFMLTFVSPVPEQPFSRTEDCTTVWYIKWLCHTSNLFSNLHLPQQCSFLLQHFSPKTFFRQYNSGTWVGTVHNCTAWRKPLNWNVAEEKELLNKSLVQESSTI